MTVSFVGPTTAGPVVFVHHDSRTFITDLLWFGDLFPECVRGFYGLSWTSVPAPTLFGGGTRCFLVQAGRIHIGCGCADVLTSPRWPA